MQGGGSGAHAGLGVCSRRAAPAMHAAAKRSGPPAGAREVLRVCAALPAACVPVACQCDRLHCSRTSLARDEGTPGAARSAPAPCTPADTPPLPPLATPAPGPLGTPTRRAPGGSPGWCRRWCCAATGRGGRQTSPSPLSRRAAGEGVREWECGWLRGVRRHKGAAAIADDTSAQQSGITACGTPTPPPKPPTQTHCTATQPTPLPSFTRPGWSPWSSSASPGAASLRSRCTCR